MHDAIRRLALLPPRLRARIPLPGSKSEANRALIILALAGADSDAWLSNLPEANDTALLRRLLATPPSSDGVFDVQDAGTVCRFLAAYLAFKPGNQILRGTARMHERPISPLVAALRTLGAEIDFLEKDGCLPLRIGPWRGIQCCDTVLLDASQSSQFATALLLVAPTLPQGLRIYFEGAVASKPYIELTVGLMRHFGAHVAWEAPDALRVAPGGYRPAPLQIEADWSAASYWYALAFAARDEAEFDLEGLRLDSLQGDRMLARMMQGAGIESGHAKGAGQESGARGLRISRSAAMPAPPMLEWDFADTPDLAPALIVACAARGVRGLFSGVDNLRLKESDRMAALKTELAKVGVWLIKLPPHFSKKKSYFMLEGQATWGQEAPVFETHGDHRIAMALSVLATRGPALIRGADAVVKSYPQYWAQFEGLLTP